MNSAATITGLGARSDYVAPAPNADPVRLRLTPEETALFASIGRAARIDELIARSSLSEDRTVATLLSLRAKGAIVPARVSRPESGGGAVDAAMSEQVDLDDERKREILAVEGALQGDHYAVLGVSPGATPEEIKQAYYERSRKFHPDRYYNKNLGSFRARIERIFKRMAEADRVLSDDERRAAYLAEHPELRRAPPPHAAAPEAPRADRVRTQDDERREQERRQRLAKHPYLSRHNKVSELVLRARAHLAKGEHRLASADLNIAAQVDAKNQEVQSLLAEARAQQAASRAAEELQRGQQAEAAGDIAAATTAYRSAANIDPSSARAAYNAARLMLAQGKDPKEIRVLAQKAVDLEPKKADHLALLGAVMHELGMKKLAQKHLEQALAIDPNNALAKKHHKKGRWLF